MRYVRRRIAIAALIIGVVATSGCADINPLGSTSTTAPPRQRPADANDADVEFLTDVVEHLRQGRALTNAALDPSVNAGDNVATLASHIEEEDASRVIKMIELLQRWGESTPPSPAPVVANEMDGLRGDAFDAQWAELMLEHHARGEALAQRVKRDGSSRLVNNTATGMLVDLGFETATLQSV